MSSPFLGQLLLFAGNFPPRGWAMCNGQLLSIAQNTALFSLLGTTYGGNGVSTFALPDLRGRVPLHLGQGPGLQDRVMGEASGVEAVTLIQQNMPAHSHTLAASSGIATTNTPAGNLIPTGQSRTFATGAAGATMSPQSIGTTGNSLPHENMQPYLVLNWVIALQGIFPSRN